MADKRLKAEATQVNAFDGLTRMEEESQDQTVSWMAFGLSIWREDNMDAVYKWAKDRQMKRMSE